MHKIFGTVFIYIFALTHHLPTISASASDLSLSSYSSTKTASQTVAASSDIATAESVDVSVKATDLFAIENNVAAKEISIAASSPSSTMNKAAAVTKKETDFGQQNLATRRQIRSLFYSYPFSGLYNNLYTGYGGSYYYPYNSYFYYPSVYKYWVGYNPYSYGYPSVIYG